MNRIHPLLRYMLLAIAVLSVSWPPTAHATTVYPGEYAAPLSALQTIETTEEEAPNTPEPTLVPYIPEHKASFSEKKEPEPTESAALAPSPTAAQRSAKTSTSEPAKPTPQPTRKPSAATATPKATTSSRSSSSTSSYKGYRVGQKLTVTVTHYCPCAKCNGKDNVGRAANGQRLADGMAALNWLPLGSIVEVNGKRYTITDRGVGTGRIDLFVSSHSRALKKGKFKASLTILRIGK